jgi:hemolysin activation/secretion protein
MTAFTPGRWIFLAVLWGFCFGSAVCAKTPVESPEATEATQKFLVQSVRIEGNTLLPESELAARVAHLIGGERTAGDLRQAARAVQAAYRQAGYAGVVAFVPEQRVASGDLVIRVVEGKLAEVRISGNQRYDQTNIRHSLPSLREGETPRVRAIDRDIQLANENPVKELRVALMAGTKPGDIDASIEVAEESPWRVLIGFDNTGDPATGDYRLSVGLQYANLWNLDHIGTVQYQTSPSDPSQVQIYSFGYRIPLYGHAASIDAFAAYSSVDNGTTATVAGPLQFAGKGKIAGLRGNRYLERIGEYDHRLTLGLDWRDLQNDCLLGAFGAAGCGTAGASIVVLPLSLTYTGQVQTPEEAWGFAGGLAHNVGGSSSEDFKAARPRADKYYSIARLTAFAGFAPADRFGLQGRLSGQYTPDALVPVEQFGVGGASSVRGYREREIAGDNGLYANLEGLAPDLRQHLGIDNGSLRPLVFVDWGQVSNHYHWPCAGTDTRCALSSFGVGVRFSVGKYLIGRFDVARTLEDGPQTPAGKTRGDIALSFVF